MAMMEDDIKSLEAMRFLPYEQLREKLRKVFEEYGVSKTKQNIWLGNYGTVERPLRRSAQRDGLCNVYDRLNRERRREDMALGCGDPRL